MTPETKAVARTTAAALAFAASFLLLSGVPPIEAAWMCAYLGLALASGAYLVTVGRIGPRSFPAILGQSVPLVVFVQLAVYLACGVSPLRNWTWCALPAAAVLVHLVRRLRHCPAVHPRQWSRPEMTATVVGAALALIEAVRLGRAFPLGTVDGAARLAVDLPWFQAMSNGLASFGVHESGLISNWPLRYHWLSYAWAGAVDEQLGLADFEALLRLIPLVTMFSLLLLAIALTRRPWLPRWTPVLAVAALMLGGYVAVARFAGGSPWDWASPSTPMSATWLLAAFVTLLWWVRGRGGRATLPVLFVLSLATVGGKGSAGTILVGGAIGMAALGLLGRRSWARRSAVAAAVIAAAVAMTFMLMISGTDPGSTVRIADMLAAGSGVTLSVVLLLAAQLTGMAAPWIGLLPAALGPARLQPLFAFGYSAAASAALLLVILDAPDGNERLFATSAATVIAPISAAGVAYGMQQFLTPLRLSHARLATSAAVLVVTVLGLSLASQSDVFDVRPWLFPSTVLLVTAGLAAVVVSWLPRPRRRSWRTWITSFSAVLFALAIAFTPATQLVSAVESGGVSPDQVDAAWMAGAQQAGDAVRAAATDDDVVALWNAATDADVSLRWVPALTGLRGYFGPDPSVARLGPAGSLAETDRRRAVLADFLTSHDPDRLCSEGVRWVWVNDPAGLDLGFVDTFVFRDSDLAVFRLACPGA